MIRTIIGKRGSGKTTLAGKFITERTKPVLIMDMLCQFETGKRFCSVAAILDYIVLAKKFNITDPLVLTNYEQKEFSLLCEIAIRHKDVMLVVDEVDFFDTPQCKDHVFKKVIHYGRHTKIDLVTTSRRPANISRDLTSQTDEFYIFRMHEKRDLDYFHELNSELPDKIKDLQQFSYIKYDHQEIKVMPPLAT